ncbi:MAG: hypothetical protein JWL95_3074 [Gemmatimonadetes bacterium]|nr:hypothetical protein [Gemmatimonadota bacterium]
MNWTRAQHDITTYDDRAALARDTVYMPSELAARLLPLDARQPSEPASWDRSARDADRRAPAH